MANISGVTIDPPSWHAALAAIKKAQGWEAELAWLKRYQWEGEVACSVLLMAGEAGAFDPFLNFNLTDQIRQSITSTAHVILDYEISMATVPVNFWERWSVSILQDGSQVTVMVERKP
jgi:hypothetical protein